MQRMQKLARQFDRSRLTPADVTSIMEDWPDLTYLGFFAPQFREPPDDQLVRKAKDRAEMLEDRALQQFARCRDYISQELGTDKDRGKMLSSYYLKHSVESWRQIQGDTDIYVTNGMFIAAAIFCGFRPRAISGPNCNFSLTKSAYDAAHKIRERSPP